MNQLRIVKTKFSKGNRTSLNRVSASALIEHLSKMISQYGNLQVNCYVGNPEQELNLSFLNTPTEIRTGKGSELGFIIYMQPVDWEEVKRDKEKWL